MAITRVVALNGGSKKTIVLIEEGTTASSGTVTPTGHARENFYSITAQAAPLTIDPPSGTAVENNSLLIRLKGTGIFSITMDSIYRAGDIPFPASTSTSTLYMQFIYNDPDGAWDFIGLTEGF